jgi:hypothetical protein
MMHEEADSGVSRGHCDGDVVAEKAPLTPTKDGDAAMPQGPARSSQTAMP